MSGKRSQNKANAFIPFLDKDLATITGGSGRGGSYPLDLSGLGPQLNLNPHLPAGQAPVPLNLGSHDWGPRTQPQWPVQVQASSATGAYAVGAAVPLSGNVFVFGSVSNAPGPYGGFNCGAGIGIRRVNR